jgi:hypothetical protein
MHRNRLVQLLILAAALNFSGCGGAAERTDRDRKATGEVATSNASSPATANGGATTVAASSNAGKADAAPSGKAVAQQSPSPGPGSAPPAKAPTPHIGSGGNDFSLFTQARGAINNDPELKGANVVVEVKEGVVTLSGAVASAALKSKAEQLARDAGPKEVRNQLRVSAGR